MSYLIKHVSDNGIGTITLNRPDRHNAFDDTMIEELTECLNLFNQNSSIRVIVLNATGENFCAGADLNWMKRMSTYDWDENYQDSLKLAALMQTLFDCNKPTVAFVQGASYGGGVGLVACCDIVLASEKSTFCLSEVKLGLLPAVISPYVVKAIGARNAKRYFATAESFNAVEAREMNLVHKIYSAEEFDVKTKNYLNKLTDNGPDAVQLSKQLVNLVSEKIIDETLIKKTAMLISDVRSSKEGKEGVSAFLEKRKPDWNI